MLPPTPAHNGSFAVRVIGHDGAIASLSRAVATGTVPQALLLVGPPAAGKRALARWLAQALCCVGSGPGLDPGQGHRLGLAEAEAPAGGLPCGLCRACRLVAEGHHPDVHLDNERLPLRIEAGLALQHVLALAPVEAPWRVAVLGEIESASPSAANSLLKTLEEPPAHAVVILTATNDDDVLPTIRSRCRSIRLRGGTPGVVAAALEADGADPAAARLVARLADGRLGQARALLADPEPLAARAVWLDALEGALPASHLDRLGVAARLAQRGDGLVEGLLAWCGWWRDLMLVQLAAEAGVTNIDRLPALRALAVRVSPEQCVRALRACQATLRQLAARTSSDLALEVLLLALPDPERIAA